MTLRQARDLGIYRANSTPLSFLSLRALETVKCNDLRCVDVVVIEAIVWLALI